MTSTALVVLYADDALIVLDKPAGLLSVPGRGPEKADCLSARAQLIYPDAQVVHRLDMATSGLMLMARGAAVLRTLGDAFAERRVSKRYVAVVHGRPVDNAVTNAVTVATESNGWSEINAPLMADWPNRPLRKVDVEHGQASLTRWRVAADQHGAEACATRLDLEPVTGRTHQLRVHLMSIGHPILGDALYAPADVQAMAPRLLLHACAIGFTHPVTGASMRFESPAEF